MNYLKILNRNAQIFMGEDPAGLSPDDLLRELIPLEQSMQVFASTTVLEAFENYRGCIRELTLWGSKTLKEKQELQGNVDIVSQLALIAIREDLRVESYESRRKRSRSRRRIASKLRLHLPELKRVAALRQAFQAEVALGKPPEQGGVSESHEARWAADFPSPGFNACSLL